MAEPVRKGPGKVQGRNESQQSDRRVSMFPDRRDSSRFDRRVPGLKGKREAAEKRQAEREEPGRGREAASPGEIPKPGWRDILKRTWAEQSKDNLSLVAAGVAFYAMLALFPAIAALISIYGLLADPAQLQSQIGEISGVLPADARSIIQSQLSKVISGAGGALSLGAAVGLLLALWSASKGMKGLIQALNISYGEEESRGFLKLNAISLLLTVSGLVFFILALTAVVAMPALLDNLGLPDAVMWTVSIARWPLLALAGMLALAVLYRYAPDRDEPRWRWVSWGSAGATMAWIAASLLFSLYVSQFGNYNETYGTLGAVVILLTWLFLTAYVVLLGAELNAQMERQTRKDTTKGKPTSMGRRGAQAADTLGSKP
ncbi:MAG: YihY/virulence factor BrkB family protein [Desulfocurvibacter africanus]